ncbi:hypothetical protein BH11PSE10_BH11PSE10_16790 [soil metagenome]
MPLAALLLSLAATLVLYGWSVRTEIDRREAEVDRLASSFSRELSSRVQSYIDTLPGLRVFAVLSHGASDLEFRQYLEAISLQKRFPGLALTFSAEFLRQQDLPAFVRGVRKDTSVASAGHPDFAVHPAGERPSYMVVRHINPAIAATFGYDLYDPAQRYRFEVDAAVQSGSYVATPPIRLAERRFEKPQPALTSVVTRLAVYRGGKTPSSATERQAALQGVVGVAFRTAELVASVLNRETRQALDLRIIDVQAQQQAQPGVQTEIFDSSWLDANADAKANARREPPNTEKVLRIAIADRDWEIRATDRMLPLRHGLASTPLLILACGLALSAVLWLALRTQVKARLIAERLVEEGTADLRAQQHNLEEAQRLAHVGNWVLELASARLVWSREGSRIFGVPEGVNTGSLENFLRAVHRDDRERVRKAITRAVSECLPLDIEYRVLRADGSEVSVHSRGEPVTDAQGRAAQIRGSVQDTTERRRAEATLEASESLYRLLFENSLDSVMQTRTDGAIIRANPAACAMFGLSEDELRRLGRAGVVDHSDPRLALLLERRSTHGSAKGSLTMIKGDGTHFESEVAASVYTDQNGEPMASLVIRDVTDQRAAEAALRAKELAEQANRAKSEFVARMSHELRTPLNAVLGFAQILQFDKAEPPSPAQRPRLQHIQRAAEHLLRLIEDLLDVSRIEAGSVRLSLLEVDPRQIVEEALRDVAQLAALQQITLSVQPAAAAESAGKALAVLADRTRLHQVLANLLSNAIKYNRSGGTVSIHFEPAPPGCLDVIVSDTGLGMDEAQLQNLFQPFNRLGREHSDIEGTGIGLVISRNLLELMGGSLHVCSKPGQGSRFTARLRRAGGGEGGAREALPVSTVPNSRADIGGRVLYIDDDEGNRLLMQAIFSLRPAMELRLSADGATGLAMAEQWRPQLILIDLMMPVMSGQAVLEALLTQPELRDTPCVAVSANAMPDDIRDALKAGFTGFVTKPLMVGDLLAEIDRLLSLKARRTPS